MNLRPSLGEFEITQMRMMLMEKVERIWMSCWYFQPLSLQALPFLTLGQLILLESRKIPLRNRKRARRFGGFRSEMEEWTVGTLLQGDTQPTIIFAMTITE